MTRTAAIAVIVFAFLAFAAGADDTGYVPDPTWQPPKAEAARPNPLAAKPQAAAGGRKLFMRNCSECHGDKRQHGAPDLRWQVVQTQPDGALFWKITNGNSRRAMPSFASLPELQRWQIVLYLRQMAHEKN
jgi:mono/diheme cytochrome c family protein